MWKIKLTKAAQKDFKIIKRSLYKNKTKELLEIIKKNPYKTPPPYEKLEPKHDKVLSRRISKQHRLVYQVNEKTKLITVVSLWSHYE